MVLPGDLQAESCSDTTPLSPEEVARTNAKNSELNESLGSCDPLMEDYDDETMVEHSPGFSDQELEHISLKNALVNTYIGCANDQESLVQENQQGAESVNPNEVTEQTAEFFRSLCTELDSDNEVSIVTVFQMRLPHK